MSDDAPSQPARQGTILSTGYTGLLLTQFLGAFNDNMFRWLVVPIGQQILPSENAATLSLALGGICFTIPYLILVATAGSLADRYSKRSVIVACKVAEIVLMLLGTAAIISLNPWFLFAVVMLMGAQSALFGPAKFGSLPEMLQPEQLSKGNGLLGLATVVASALGTVAGFRLFGAVETRGLLTGGGMAAVWPAAAALVAVAVAGTLTSLWMQRLPAADATARLKFDPFRETWPALRLLSADRRLMRTALGIGFFWFLASLCQLNIDPFGDEIIGLAKQDIGLLLAVLVAGLGAGSVLAGWWSGGKVELGIVPLGALGIIVTSLLLFAAGNHVVPDGHAMQQPAFWWACFWLFQLGASAGLFNIPLETYLQHESDDRNRGTILAASNFVSFALILFSCGLFYLLRDGLQLPPGMIFLVAGLGTIPVAVYVFKLLPNVTVRFLFWLASNTVYRLRVYGRENVPEKGGALLVANHVSWVDGILVLVSSSRMVRFLVYADYTKKPGLAWLSRIMGVIPIKSTEGPKAIVRALQTAKEAVQNGEVVCIFAEGQLTRTGQMQSFQPGLMRIVGGTGAPVIPMYLHGLWGSIFSYRGGRYFWKWPKKWPYPVSIHFGKPLSEPEDVNEVRQAVEELGALAVETDKPRRLIPVRQFIRQCKRTRFRAKVADSSGLELTGGKFLAGSIALLRALEREVLAPDEKTVGVLLPPAVGGAVANIALALGRRVSANLNYTMSDETLDVCVRQAGIRHVLTSRKFLEKKPIQIPSAEYVYLEDLKTKVTAFDKLRGALSAFFLPAGITDRLLGLNSVKPDDLLTIIFTSGSTGEPKGVMLSHANIGSNVDAVDQILNLNDDDVLLGVLPFFHSFGYTASLWLVLCYEPKAVYHYNPLDARMIGKLSQDHKVTIVMATPTFLRGYMRRIEPEQFKHLDLAVVGAEKMPLDLYEQFKAKYGVGPSEGYGTTELSPVVSINIPDHRSTEATQIGTKLGTVGRPIPGVVAKVVEPDTWQDLGIDKEGLLLIKGPNVMLGYLNQPEKTADLIRDGWYNTGDYALIDRDGFIKITGRMSRFSKIGGEMVPHLRIEEEIARFVDSDDDAADHDGPDIRVAVTAVPDAHKGERIIVVHKPLSKSTEEIRDSLSIAGLPNIWIPGADSFLEVEQIPMLGTGKLDLKGLQQLALAHYGAAELQHA